MDEGRSGCGKGRGEREGQAHVWAAFWCCCHGCSAEEGERCCCCCWGRGRICWTGWRREGGWIEDERNGDCQPRAHGEWRGNAFGGCSWRQQQSKHSSSRRRRRRRRRRKRRIGDGCSWGKCGRRQGCCQARGDDGRRGRRPQFAGCFRFGQIGAGNVHPGRSQSYVCRSGARYRIQRHGRKGGSAEQGS
jgi:hypothetical protein